MPWPDVTQALQTGVINGLDHTAIVCNITKKFTVAKHFTELDYAQGLFIHLMNKRWFDRLPADLQKILLDTITEESALSRDLTRKQYAAEVEKAKADGVTFHKLPEGDIKKLVDQASPVYQAWGEKIGTDYLKKVRATLGN
jgi:TRAP-type C4-dicarboxylate transport system substrate-binding protein